MSKPVPIGVRLAIRKEGRFVNAYIAKQEDMQGAMLIGSIMTSILERDDAVWQRWKALMSDVLQGAVQDVFGQTPNMAEAKAPEHERAGEA